jgi:hypothetical protein
MSDSTLRQNFFTANSLVADLYHLCAGEYLGQGISRTVHVFLPDPTWVIKFEHAGYSFQNVNEWELWNAIKTIKSVQASFAPCRLIANTGTILLQKRTTPATIKMLPKRIPVWFTDLKVSNWGMLDGRPVCHDYGTHHTVLANYAISAKTRKADWWDE